VVEVLVVLAVLVGAALQRVTGIGFALVVAPFLVLLLGPVQGVLLVNVTGALASGLILLQVVRQVQWRRFALLAPAALVGTAIGALVVAWVPPPVLELGIGALLIVALTTMLVLRDATMRARRRHAVAAGLLSGFMNSTAGLGGPAVTVYAVATRWPQEPFRATMQAFFFTIGCSAIGAKLLSGAAGLPELSTVLWIAVGGAALCGLAAGGLLARRMPADAVRPVLIAVSYVGAVATMARGAVGVIG
jgi:uncharacterized membrane protein YfcA